MSPVKRITVLLGCVLVLLSGIPFSLAGHPGGDGAAVGIYSLDVCQASGAAFPGSIKVTCIIEKPVDFPAFISAFPLEEESSAVGIPILHVSIDHPPRL